MGVRVRLRVRALKGREGAEADVVALCNTGYETEDPEVTLPTAIAAELGLWPLPQEAEVCIGEAYGGTLVEAHRVKGAIEVAVLVEDRLPVFTRCHAVIHEREREVLLSDATISALRIEIIDPKQGLWRFVDEPKDVKRASA